MSEANDTRNECRVFQDDSDGNPNLCCCYILEPEGGYSDPCYVPVGGCCINHEGGT